MQKKISLGLIGALSILSVVAVSADEISSPTVVSTISSSGKLISQDRMEFREQAKLTHEKNKELKKESKEARKEFRSTNSGALHDMRKEMTASGKLDVKKAHEDREDFIKSLSGMTLEQKAESLSGAEDKIRKEIEARFATSSGALLEKRMDVYTQNASRRIEMLTNQINIRAARWALRSSEVDVVIAKITTELTTLSAEKKAELVKKIDARIKDVQENKRLPDASKTDIITKLTSLRDTLTK